jgi:hypothetical protein
MTAWKKPALGTRMNGDEFEVSYPLTRDATALR